jgi:hypothetical protein
MQRPLSATAALRALSPHKTIGTSYYVNRLNSVRDESPQRPRANSVKRKADRAVSYAEIAGPKQFWHVVSDEEKKNWMTCF